MSLIERDFSFNFKYVCNFDVNEIIDIVKDYDKEWHYETDRQQIFPEHSQTFSVFITKIPLLWQGYGYPYKICKLPEQIERLEKIVRPIINSLEAHYNGKNGRSLVTKLIAGGEIPTHNDNGYYLEGIHRCHIPIITNNQVDFTVNGEVITMKVVECYEINNKIHHRVQNNGEIDRVHLIVDIIPSKMFR